MTADGLETGRKQGGDRPTPWPVHRPFLPMAILIVLILQLQPSGPATASELETLAQARLVARPYNDGDSFLIEAADGQIHVRLYYVDCPESHVSTTSDTRRLQEQTRYFGLPHPLDVVHFGKKAKNFVRHSLARPFTVHTARARAPGRSRSGRVYAFVTTADGKDLGTLLVATGLARVHGIRRNTPTGIDSDEMRQRLKDLESSAMLKRRGVWSKTDPDRLAALRAQQRRLDRQASDLIRAVKRADAPAGPIDVNACGLQELTTINGIGPELARRIVAGRPYRNVGELMRVKGIGQKRLERLKRSLTVNP